MSFVQRTTLGVMRARLAEGWRRFEHGFLQFLLAFQALHRDALAWKRYLRACTIQAVVTLALATASLSLARQSSEGLREERVRKALQSVASVESHDAQPAAQSDTASETRAPRRRAHTKPKPPAAAVAKGPTSAEDAAESAADAAEARNEFQDKLHELQKALVDLSSKAGPTAVRRDRPFQKAREELDKQLSELEDDAVDLPLSAEDKATLIQLGAQLDVLEQKTKPGWWDSAWALVLSLYGALSVAQSIVIALSRDYHVAIARDASLLLGVAPEDPPTAPRVRLNVAWIRRKFRQRTRSVLAFIPGVALISLAALAFPQRALVTSLLTAMWAVYWWVVWTASKSARAWERNGVAPPPFFLRWWHGHLAPLPFVGGVLRLWEALWARLTRAAYSPAEAVEAQPVEFSGLAAARALQLVPLLKLYVRPLVPVAAARLLAERSTLRLASPKQQAYLAAERAAVPASPGALAARDQM